MLAFDITDRNVRVIKGNEAGGKIKIISSANISIEEGLIANGYIKDIAAMATLIINGLKENHIKDTEAVVSISSNLVMFRELHVPKAKPAQFKQLVQAQMAQNSVSEDNAISFTIAGDVEEEGQEMSRVLANACPKNVIDSIKRVFSMLGISLKSISVSCNCISRLVLANPAVASMMPFMLVQVDPNFININLYESGQLCFSRFASISADDYDDKNDYMYQAVNENIFRMFQFQKTRSNQAIQNVIFYGDCSSDFVRLTNSLEQMDIKATLLKIPPQLSGYENLEFSLYANAIGAMYKRPKDNDTTNLMTVDTSSVAVKQEQSPTTVAIQALASFLIAAALVGITVAGLAVVNNAIISETGKIDQEIQSHATEIAELEAQEAMLAKLNTYDSKYKVAYQAFTTKPFLGSEDYEAIKTCLGEQNIVSTVKYSEGVLSVEFIAEEAIDPAELVKKLYDLDRFDNIEYVGFKEEEKDIGAIADVLMNNNAGFKYTINVTIRGLMQENEQQGKAPIENLTPPAVEETNTEEGGVQ